jgi:hypothetical protein
VYENVGEKQGILLRTELRNYRRMRHGNVHALRDKLGLVGVSESNVSKFALHCAAHRVTIPKCELH